MSHHLDSPLARQDVRLDLTDLYVFRGETGTVLAINLCHSLAGEIPTPGYHPEGKYEFNLDQAQNLFAGHTVYSIAANTAGSLGIGRVSVTSKPGDSFPYVPAVS